MDFDFVAAIGGLVEVEVGALRGAFGDGLIGSVVSVLRDIFLPVDLEIVGTASVLDDCLGTVFGSVIGGVLGSPSKVDAVCALAVGDMK